ncbi:MAG: hypothetical protein LBM27_05230 [Lactobacillaceae bacterium]|jgi:acetyl-CoA carboxylase carboxyl transferase subunit alpha|nr:hypothetical protein [Lactobacillaceae bacterium]
MANNLLNELRSAQRFDAKDFIENQVTDFDPFKTPHQHPSLIAGTGILDGQKVSIIATFRGRDLVERMATNFGAVTSTGYKAALEALELSTQAKLPIITFVEMPGADASVQSENDNQSIAIAKFMLAMGQYPYKNVGVILSEGHSGGALAFVNTNRILMLEDAIFNVASPEVVSTILKDKYSGDEILDISPMRAVDLLKIGFADVLIPKNDDKKTQAQLIKKVIVNSLNDIRTEDLISERAKKFNKI